MSDLLPFHRREFARQCLGGLGAATLTATITAADTPPPALPEDPQRELPSPEVLQLSLLTRQYPSEKYSEENIQSIYGDIAADLARSKQLRAFPLVNGDHPAVAFCVFRADVVEGAR